MERLGNMARVKRRIFSGSVCEQEIFTIAGNRKDLQNAEPIERFTSEEERTQHREKMARRHHERIFNNNFSPASIYTTLTMDDDHEVHTFKEARTMRNNYVRRLKTANPDAQISIYMGRGKSTSRIHFHMVSNGLSEETIKAKWQAGEIIRAVHLREHNYYDGVDHGQDYTGLANYLFDHWTQEQGGHHYKATRNLQRPKLKEPDIIKRNYSESKPPRMPEGYKLVEYTSNAFGYQYFKFVYIPKKKTSRLKC
jgi:hypothetical protein